MHLRFYLAKIFQSCVRFVFATAQTFHDIAKYREIAELGGKLRRVLAEEWNNDLLQVVPIEHFVPIALLMIGSFVGLEVDAAASEVLFQSIEDIFILFYQLDVESRLDIYSPLHRTVFVRITNIGSKTSLAIDNTDDIFRT